MAVDDLWYLTRRGPDGQRLKSARHGRGKRYRVRYVDDAGRARQILFERRADADRFDANVRADVSRGLYVDPAAGQVYVADYGRAWRGEQLHRDSTAERVESAFRLHIDPYLGGLRMAQVRQSHLRTWVKGRAGVLAPTTLRVVHSYLASMFTAAALDRVIGVSPCAGRGVTLPDVDDSELVIATAEQIHALSAALAPRLRAQPVFAAGTGLRQGEVWGLELEHVDFLRRKVTVVQQLKSLAGRPPFLAPLKTATSARSVELPQVAAEALARHLERWPAAEVDIDDETDPRRPHRRTAKLIFTNSVGHPICRNSWSPLWTPAVAAAGLPKGFGFHGLRHYYATVLIYGGANVKTVQKALGHSTPMVTLNTYVGHWPDAIDTTRDLVDAALRATAAGPRAVTG